ncbi:hypothetical protein CNMCM5793_008801 [Aspergillus hiratsukae]|uniref:Dienelactone hydrolase domain-containing protein n=1 Tax=Aspergillus hiratsukae TaxID=1194566 RepID=A0A8H6PYF4_9EURO|nr:hypothetical protein CNMCM5793_008801 [Aspergillus hiratsukae]KAF7162487.1 hypothetical protein CNMCM6106_009404 [Aspergillus hiratsukae]
MSVSACCLKGFEWEGTPSGRTAKLAKNDVYIAGDNPDVAIIIIHDLLGWTFPNLRLPADHYAREANATVYIPDFFGGEVLPLEPILKGEWEKLDIRGFVGRNDREIRDPEIFDCARVLRENYKKVGVGHQPPLVDCIMVGHPSLLIEWDIDEIAVPVQILAPEHDPMYTTELKRYTFNTLSRLGVPFDHQHYPGVEHGCLARGDSNKAGEREAMARGKNAAVSWFTQWLHQS